MIHSKLSGNDTSLKEYRGMTQENLFLYPYRVLTEKYRVATERYRVLTEFYRVLTEHYRVLTEFSFATRLISKFFFRYNYVQLIQSLQLLQSSSEGERPLMMISCAHGY